MVPHGDVPEGTAVGSYNEDARFLVSGILNMASPKQSFLKYLDQMGWI